MTSPAVPEDFPHAVPAVVSGSQAKVIVRRTVEGRYVAETQEERLERWSICEDLAQQLVPIARKHAAKHPADERDVTLQRLGKAVASKGWVSPEELHWLMRRARVLLDW